MINDILGSYSRCLNKTKQTGNLQKETQTRDETTFLLTGAESVAADLCSIQRWYKGYNSDHALMEFNLVG